MKRMVFAALLLLLLASVSLADSPKYQIFSEDKGFWGLGGRRIIMLDKTTGDSWLFTDNKWVPILKAVPEAKVAEDETKAKFEAELAALKDKQSEAPKILKQGLSSNPENIELMLRLARYYAEVGPDIATAKVYFAAAIDASNRAGKTDFAASLKAEMDTLK